MSAIFDSWMLFLVIMYKDVDHFCGATANDHCVSQPCASGFCINSINSYTCICLPGFAGRQCDQVSDLCAASNPCQNNGTCQRSGSNLADYTCRCLPGFSGRNCSVDIDECALHLCQNNGTCVDLVDGRRCECGFGFEGVNCERSLDFCSSSPCLNNATCHNNVTKRTYTCDCLPYSKGRHCERRYENPCTSNPCSRNQKCIEGSGGTFACQCNDFFIGDSCDIFQCPCGNHGRCVRNSPEHPYSCVCKNGYDGKYCEHFLGDCHRRAGAGSTDLSCAADKLCHNTDYGYTCLCPPHLAGRRCMERFVCGGNYSCHNGGICQPINYGRYKCVCKAGYTGQFCDFDVNECMNNPCKNNGACTEDHLHSYRCHCQPGFCGRVCDEPCPTTTPAPTTPHVATTHDPRNVTCADEPCNGYPCIDQEDNGLKYLCLCGHPTIGPECSQQPIKYPRFSGHSFMKFQVESVIKISVLKVQFHTIHQNGLFFHASHEKLKDYVALLVVEGYVWLICNAGDNNALVRSTEAVTNGSVVIVEVILTKGPPPSAMLKVRGQPLVSRTLHGTLQTIDVTSMYLGGAPSSPAMSINTAFDGFTVPESNFTGCVKHLEVNGNAYQLNNTGAVEEWIGISDCTVSACERGGVCQNNSTCISDVLNKTSYKCMCDHGFHGEQCQLKLNYCSATECNNGTCVWSPWKHDCLCPYGKGGGFCDQDISIKWPMFRVVDRYSAYIAYTWTRTGKLSADRFEIKLQFRVGNSERDCTLQPQNGLLVLMSSRINSSFAEEYFAIGLLNSYVILLYNLGSGPAVIKSLHPISCQRVWHSIIAGLVGQDGFLVVDNQQRVEGHSMGAKSTLHVDTPLFIGGVPMNHVVPSEVNGYFWHGFNGMIYGAAVRTGTRRFRTLLTSTNEVHFDRGIFPEDGFNIQDGKELDCTSQPCHNNSTCVIEGMTLHCQCKPSFTGVLCEDAIVSCVEYNPCHGDAVCRDDGFLATCDCPLGWSGHFCAEEIQVVYPYFGIHSFLQLSFGQDVREQTNFDIRFKSDSVNGLLFYAGEDIRSKEGKAGDFFAISILQGYVMLMLNGGGTTTSMQTNNKVLVGEWHSLKVSRMKKDVKVCLDGLCVGQTAKGSLQILNLGTNFFIGGVRYHDNMIDDASVGAPTPTEFNGCISHLEINSHVYDITTNNNETVGRNIVDCSGVCSHHQCQNGGECKPDEVDPYSCLCPIGFTGRHCNVPAHASTCARFTYKSYWLTRQPSFDVLDEYEFQLSFNTNLGGLIIWHGHLEDPRSDFIALGIENSTLRVILNLNGTETIHDYEGVFTDGKNHTYSIRRPMGSGVNDDASGWNRLNADGMVYIGGVPGNTSVLTRGHFSHNFIGQIFDVGLGPRHSVIDFRDVSYARGLDVHDCEVSK